MGNPTVETKTWLALKSRLATLVLNPVHPIAWPNVSFSQPVDSNGAPKGYLRATWVPNSNNRLFLKGADPHERLSLLQVDVFEKINEDAAVAIEVAGLVAEHFPADLKMAYSGIIARVQRSPDVAQAMPQDVYVQVPVTIPIVVFA